VSVISRLWMNMRVFAVCLRHMSSAFADCRLGWHICSCGAFLNFVIYLVLKTV
jgi:hypothetical protein